MAEKSTYTPKELAQELNFDSRRLRRLLRKRYGLVGRGQRWVLEAHHIVYLWGCLQGSRGTGQKLDRE